MSKLDDLAAWRNLIAFSKTGTLSAAAELLGVDVSNLSRSIAGLEKALGCDLIRHNSRPMELSDTGKLVVKRMTPIVRAHDALMQKIIDDNSALSGNIRLSSAPGFAARRLTPLLQRFHEMYPQITIEILSGFRPSTSKKACATWPPLRANPLFPAFAT